MDLTKWTQRRSPTSKSLRAVNLFKDKLIISGEQGLILWSDSLQEFNTATLLEPTTDWFEDIAISDSLAVTVGDSGSIYTSQDGVQWEKQPQPFSDWLTAVYCGQCH